MPSKADMHPDLAAVSKRLDARPEAKLKAMEAGIKSLTKKVEPLIYHSSSDVRDEAYVSLRNATLLFTSILINSGQESPFHESARWFGQTCWTPAEVLTTDKDEHVEFIKRRPDVLQAEVEFVAQYHERLLKHLEELSEVQSRLLTIAEEAFPSALPDDCKGWTIN